MGIMREVNEKGRDIQLSTLIQLRATIRDNHRQRKTATGIHKNTQKTCGLGLAGRV